jgi:hypothetical protein
MLQSHISNYKCQYWHQNLQQYQRGEAVDKAQHTVPLKLNPADVTPQPEGGLPTSVVAAVRNVGDELF